MTKKPLFLVNVKFRDVKSKLGSAHTYTAANSDTKYDFPVYKIIASQIAPPSAVSLINRFVAMSGTDLHKIKAYIKSLTGGNIDFKKEIKDEKSGQIIKPIYNSYLEKHLRVLTSDEYANILDIDGDEQSGAEIKNVFPDASITKMSMDDYLNKGGKADLTIFNNCLHHYDDNVYNKLNPTGDILICDLDIATEAQRKSADIAHNLFAYVLADKVDAPKKLNYLSKLDTLKLFKKKVIGESQVNLHNNMLNEYAILIQ
jgi:hypothetical protein